MLTRYAIQEVFHGYLEIDAGCLACRWLLNVKPECFQAGHAVRVLNSYFVGCAHMFDDGNRILVCRRSRPCALRLPMFVET